MQTHVVFLLSLKFVSRKQNKSSNGTLNPPGNSMTLFKLSRTLSLIIAVMFESNRLGAIVTTRIPFLARSRVNGKVRETIAPLDAAYATNVCYYLGLKYQKRRETHLDRVVLRMQPPKQP